MLERLLQNVSAIISKPLKGDFRTFGDLRIETVEHDSENKNV